MPRRRSSDAEHLASITFQLQQRLRKASRDLHDEVGPFLSAAGLRLQLLRLDLPEAGQTVQEILELLDGAMERTRAVSRELSLHPTDQIGLKNAFQRLAEQHAWLAISYSATAQVPADSASSLYEAALRTVLSAQQAGATRVRIGVTGKSAVRVQVQDNAGMRGRAQALSVMRRLAGQAGLNVHVTTGKSTIVSIHYAHRRPTRG
jgi:signal transduction histidine kinase